MHKGDCYWSSLSCKKFDQRLIDFSDQSCPSGISNQLFTDFQGLGLVSKIQNFIVGNKSKPGKPWGAPLINTGLLWCCTFKKKTIRRRENVSKWIKMKSETKTEGKKSKHNLMLMKTGQGERGEKMSRDLSKQRMAQKEGDEHAGVVEETFVPPWYWESCRFGEGEKH